VYLDIKTVAGRRTGAGRTGRRSDEAGDGADGGDEFMTADVAAGILADAYDPDLLGVAVARAGSPDPVVVAGSLAGLADREFGPPLHALVIPGELHHLEAEALATFADAPVDLLEVA
jgi:diphthine synthase